MSIFINILLAINLLIAILIIFVTLMQRPKQEGLGAAFGGGMTENLFGAQTTNVLQTITRWLATFFFLISITVSAIYARQSTSKSSIQKQLLEQPVPAAAQSPAPAEGSTAPAEATPAAPAATAPAADAPVTPAEAAKPEAAPSAPEAAASEAPAEPTAPAAPAPEAAAQP